MDKTIATFTSIFAISVVACVIVAGAWPVLIFAVLGYAVGMLVGTCLNSYGLNSYGLNSCGLNSHGLNSYGLNSYGLNSYGVGYAVGMLVGTCVCHDYIRP